MKQKVNSQRRKLFAKFGIGAISAGILGAVPFKLFASSNVDKKNSEKSDRQQSGGSVSITINPMAVKREKRK